ncbi:leukotriene A4 hydrolase [Thraustotheca clavata]|uniref:Leukotriene A4 hydrolase n=1 Tax=Thraustotheca clavata TaxID=74557 RepID=A0A1V9ZHB9_9STRA|nr:leukotriene A4 hydrolase [Thraustotheca clavata]
MSQRVDKHTLANLSAIAVHSLDLHLTADFDRSALHGYVDIEAEVLEETNEVILDTRALYIKSATIDGVPTLKKQIDDEVFGTALHLALPEALQAVGSKFTARVYYETTPESSAIQWLPKEQTADKEYPYLFTQCQAIHARSLLPCQDCPMAKSVYKGTITVPSWAKCLMSAVASAEPESDGEFTKFYYEQNVAVPSYLIAIVIGHIDSREVGPRSRVWSEPSQVDAVAYEFAQTEDFLRSAEEIMDQEYVWGRYDMVSLPPSFPFGGMENPCLTFATPTLLAGDRSLADVIAHEIAHSWTGNLITNHTWEHFWLNEGWTMWLQRKIMAKIHSDLHFDFDAIIGWTALQDSIDHFGADHEFTKLVPTLDGADPDDSFSSVPYEKGFNLLYYLSKLVGDDEFETFAKAYVHEFKYKTVTSDQFRDFFVAYFSETKADELATIDWDTWFYATGMPARPNFDTTISSASAELADRWVKGEGTFESSDIEGWTSSQIIVTLEAILEKCTERNEYLSHEVLENMGTLYNLAETKNSEVRFRYQTLCVRAEYSAILPQVEEFLKEQGRMKFVRPLYRDLYKSEFGKEEARRIFGEWKEFYHPIARKMIYKDLGY